MTQSLSKKLSQQELSPDTKKSQKSIFWGPQVISANRYSELLNTLYNKNDLINDRILNNSSFMTFIFSLFCHEKIWSFFGARYTDMIKIYQLVSLSSSKDQK